MNIILKDTIEYYGIKNRFIQGSDFECLVIKKSYCGFVFGYKSLFFNKELGFGIEMDFTDKEIINWRFAYKKKK